MKQILVQETFKKKLSRDIRTQNSKQYIQTKKFFNHKKSKNDQQLSNELWKIKALKEEPVLVWKILGQYQQCNVNTKRCLLYLNEELQINIYIEKNMLIKRTEIICKCKHRKS